MLLILTLLFGFIVLCIFFSKRTGYSKMLSGAFLLFFAAGAVLLLVKKFLFDTPLFDLAAGLFLFGAFLLLISLFLIQTLFLCRQPVSATYIGFHTYRSRGASSYAPTFSYEWNGVFYEEQSPRSESARFLKRFTPGSPCTIYINPNNPQQCCAARHFRFSDALITLCAIFLLTCGIALLANMNALLPFITY